ncbi:MAG: DUF1015 domain-containing protein [Rhodospirillales bacterium]|nr:DUF1015 domain-containing protein [Rhodospirillales bacterium]
MNTVNLPLLRPFPALRPAPGRAAEVAAPPYDVLDSAEARMMAAGRPWSFLHVSKPEIDLDPGIDVYSAPVYAKAAANFTRMIEQGVLVRDPAPRYYVYRLAMGDHVQTGIVGGASIAAYESGRIRRHELTRPSKEDDRVRQVEAVSAHTGPVMIAHRPNTAIKAVLADQAKGEPASSVELAGVHHTLWVVSDAQVVGTLRDAFDGLDALYIADGHHRSNAAVRVAKARRAAGGTAPDAWYESFLTVVFAADEMRILDYNRVVRDLNGLDAGELLRRVEEHFTVEPTAGEARPRSRREFGMYVAGRWYRLAVRNEPKAGGNAVAGLDISLLTERLLSPVLGIGDPRVDPRIDFVGGIRGLKELAWRVDSGEMAVAFAVYPTSMEDLMAVSDAGQIMPPKSTWFEPKLADGLVSLMLD